MLTQGRGNELATAWEMLKSIFNLEMEELTSPGDGGNWIATKKYVNCVFVYQGDDFLCLLNFCHFKLFLKQIYLNTARETICPEMFW